MANKEIGMLLLGIAIGTIIPNLPPPIDVISPYRWVLFLVVALFLLISKSHGGE